MCCVEQVVFVYMVQTVKVILYFFPQVLTANIGSLLDLYGVEKGLDHFRSTAGLNFEHFIFYLDSEVILIRNKFSRVNSLYGILQIIKDESYVDKINNLRILVILIFDTYIPFDFKFESCFNYNSPKIK